MNRKRIIKQIFQTGSDDEFNELAIEIFRYQHENNRVYHDFTELIGVKKHKISHYTEIPFLPVGFFKTHMVMSTKAKLDQFFESSRTTGDAGSRHYYSGLELYENSFRSGFRYFYGDVADYCILALLPSYLEQKHSSLVYMVRTLITDGDNPNSGFYLYDHDCLAKKLKFMDATGQKVILFGVSYALLDFIETSQFNLKNTIVLETGGMKGRRKEMTREELHGLLCKGFGVSEIHSEYGMTELFSQAWSAGSGIYQTSPWMKILISDVNDRQTLLPPQRSGGINVIDLANLDSCSFIATQDLGKTHSDGSFEVLGRFDNSDIRGCNLLVV